MRRLPSKKFATTFERNTAPINNAVLINITPLSEERIVLWWIFWSFDTDPAGDESEIQISTIPNSIERFILQLTSLSGKISFKKGFYMGKGEALQVGLIPGGAGAVGNLNIAYS